MVRARWRCWGMKWLFALMFSAIPYAAGAQVFAGYDAFCGLPVVVNYDPQVATARTDQYGNKFIHVDPGVMANWTHSRMFTLAHECAHHLLGHTNPLGAQERFRGGTRRQELEADCWAAQALQGVGHSFDINRAMLQHASDGHFSAGGYPSGTERAQNILQCVSGGGGTHGLTCRTVTRACTHAAHPGGDRVACSHYVAEHPYGDFVPCLHNCYPYGPCHPNGHAVSCQHPAREHRFDVVACTHRQHTGHSEEVCS